MTATADIVYHRPATLEEAAALSREFGADGVFLAGGSELLLAVRAGTLGARHLISLRDVPGMTGIAEDGDSVTIGAMTPLADVAASAVLRQRFPVLTEAAAKMAGHQVRNRATIGGNFAAAVPCADTPPPCLVGEARVMIAGSDGPREVDASAFFRGPRETVLEPGEILVGIRIPAQPASSGAAYARFSRRKANALAVASVAARVVLAGDGIGSARIALGAVAPVPWLAAKAGESLAGATASEEAFERAATTAAEEASPITDVRGTESERRDLVRVLTIRALRDATRRAQQQGEGA